MRSVETNPLSNCVLPDWKGTTSGPLLGRVLVVVVVAAAAAVFIAILRMDQGATLTKVFLPRPIISRR